MKPEEFEVYVIPPNFMEGGTLFGGLLKTRNTIEAVILGLAVGVPVLHLPFSLTVRVVILCLTALPLVLLALIGVSGMSLSAFIRLFFCFLHNRRILSRDGTQGGKNGKTLLPSWAQQRKSDCEAEDPPLPKSRSRFSVDLKQRSVTQFKTFLQEEEAVQPLNALQLCGYRQAISKETKLHWSLHLTGGGKAAPGANRAGVLYRLHGTRYQERVRRSSYGRKNTLYGIGTFPLPKRWRGPALSGHSHGSP